MPDAYYKLDNPAWYALTETHAVFSTGNNEVKRYRPDIVAFAAHLSAKENILNLPDQLFDNHESFFIIGDLPRLAPNYVVESILSCVQMICISEIKTPITTAIEKLNRTDDDQMVELINLVQPGYYKAGTRLMGEYFGIRQNGQLVSITGERMRMNGFTEISAVVTHPDFTGRNFAQQLIAHVTNKNLAAEIIPFLHVVETNQRAIRIYEHLGFIKRRVIIFSKIKREG